MNSFFVKLLFLIIFNISFAQNSGIIDYRVKTEKFEQKKDLDENKVRYTNFFNEFLSLQERLSFVLLFNGNESYFFLDKKKNLGLSRERMYDALMRSQLSYSYYRDNISDSIIKEINSDRKYLISYDANLYSWKTYDETKLIDGILCFKATCIDKGVNVKGEYERMVVAWYSPKYNIPFGPLGFGGLPGLIIELKIGKHTYYVDNIKFEANVIIEKPNKGKFISREKYGNNVNKIGESVFAK